MLDNHFIIKKFIEDFKQCLDFGIHVKNYDFYKEFILEYILDYHQNSIRSNYRCSDLSELLSMKYAKIQNIIINKSFKITKDTVEKLFETIDDILITEQQLIPKQLILESNENSTQHLNKFF